MREPARWCLTAAAVIVAGSMCAAGASAVKRADAVKVVRAGNGVDVDFYTGPVARAVWREMSRARIKYAVAQAWGGRSRNEFAAAQLAGARQAGMRTAAYVLLNYDDRVCRTYAAPERDGRGRCNDEPVAQPEPGSRWQVRQGLAALGPERGAIAFVAIDVEWFSVVAPSTDTLSRAARRQAIADAVDEVRRAGKRAVIYTRNARRHWADITGCEATTTDVACVATGTHPLARVPLWDVHEGEPTLGGFQPYANWTRRAGRQFRFDANLFGLPKGRTVDLNVFDPSLFRPSR